LSFPSPSIGIVHTNERRQFDGHGKNEFFIAPIKAVCQLADSDWFRRMMA
jgi:hypothetical protein